MDIVVFINLAIISILLMLTTKKNNWSQFYQKIYNITLTEK